MRVAATVVVRELNNGSCSMIQVDVMDYPEAVAESTGLPIREVFR